MLMQTFLPKQRGFTSDCWWQQLDAHREDAGPEDSAARKPVVVERLHSAKSGDFSRMISGVFKPYMPLYLKLERAHMADLVKKLIQEETWGARSNAGAEEGEDDEEEQQVRPGLLKPCCTTLCLQV
jgi:hypothetical protein